MQRMTERQAAQVAEAQGQYDGLSRQRDELQAQLKSLNARRNQLDEQRHVASSSARPGIETRMAEIDAQTARLDRQIASLNDQISAALERVTALSSGGNQRVIVQPPAVREIRIPEISIPPMDFGRSRGMNPRDVAGFMALEAVLLGAMGVLFWRMGMKRMRDQFERMFMAQSQQIQQLQQSMDVVGIEVERISEGQRYVAKVLADKGSEAALGAGRAKSI